MTIAPTVVLTAVLLAAFVVAGVVTWRWGCRVIEQHTGRSGRQAFEFGVFVAMAFAMMGERRWLLFGMWFLLAVGQWARELRHWQRVGP